MGDGRMMVRLILILGLFLMQRGVGQTSVERAPWSTKQVIDFQLSLRESLMVQDVHKLLFLANFGVEHLLTDTSAVRSYLLNELESMDTTDRKEELVERISIRDDIVRINLRPFKALNLDPEILVKAMIQSAAETRPDTTMFYRQCNEFRDLVRYGFLPFPPDEVDVWHQQIGAGDLKPVHHSGPYMRAHAPAYRVVQRRIFEDLMMRGNE